MLGEVVEAALDSEIGGAVDHRLDPESTAFLQVLLDARMLVVRVDGDLGAPCHHPGGELTLGVAADPAREDELDLVGTTYVEVVGDSRLEEGSSPARGVEDDGAADLELAHGELPPESGQSI